MNNMKLSVICCFQCCCCVTRGRHFCIVLYSIIFYSFANCLINGITVKQQALAIVVGYDGRGVLAIFNDDLVYTRHCYLSVYYDTLF